MPRKVKVAKIEPEEVKVKAKGERKKKALIAHEVLLKELAKVKTPVKSQRRANKKQDALDIKDFVSKTKPKDQVTQLLEGIRIKRALDAQYKKMSDKANEKLKKDILDITTKSKDREVSERIKAEDLKVITDKRDAELLVLDEAKYQRQLQRDRILDAQKERRQLTLEAGREQRREDAQNQRQQEIEDREEAKYQQRQMIKISGQRGRPIGSYSTLPTLAADDGSYSDASFQIVSKDSVIKDAKALGLPITGKKEVIARRIVNKKPESEEAVDLFAGLETLANSEFRPTLMITPDLLGGAKLKKPVDEEGALPKAASVPTRPSGAPPMELMAQLKSG